VGQDSFTYYAYNGKVNSLTPATVRITVNALPNTTPTAIGFIPAPLTAGQLTAGQKAGILSCTDAENPTCTYTLSSQSTPDAFTVT
jgi:hypothetical protein